MRNLTELTKKTIEDIPTLVIEDTDDNTSKKWTDWFYRQRNEGLTQALKKQILTQIQDIERKTFSVDEQNRKPLNNWLKLNGAHTDKTDRIYPVIENVFEGDEAVKREKVKEFLIKMTNFLGEKHNKQDTLQLTDEEHKALLRISESEAERIKENKKSAFLQRDNVDVQEIFNKNNLGESVTFEESRKMPILAIAKSPASATSDSFDKAVAIYENNNNAIRRVKNTVLEGEKIAAALNSAVEAAQINNKELFIDADDNSNNNGYVKKADGVGKNSFQNEQDQERKKAREVIQPDEKEEDAGDVVRPDKERKSENISNKVATVEAKEAAKKYVENLTKRNQQKTVGLKFDRFEEVTPVAKKIDDEVNYNYDPMRISTPNTGLLDDALTAVETIKHYTNSSKDDKRHCTKDGRSVAATS